MGTGVPVVQRFRRNPKLTGSLGLINERHDEHSFLLFPFSMSHLAGSLEDLASDLEDLTDDLENLMRARRLWLYFGRI